MESHQTSLRWRPPKGIKHGIQIDTETAIVATKGDAMRDGVKNAKAAKQKPKQTPKQGSSLPTEWHNSSQDPSQAILLERV